MKPKRDVGDPDNENTESKRIARNPVVDTSTTTTDKDNSDGDGHSDDSYLKRTILLTKELLGTLRLRQSNRSSFLVILALPDLSLILSSVIGRVSDKERGHEFRRLGRESGRGMAA